MGAVGVAEEEGGYVNYYSNAPLVSRARMAIFRRTLSTSLSISPPFLSFILSLSLSLPLEEIRPGAAAKPSFAWL